MERSGLLNPAEKTFDILSHSMGLCRTLTERDDKWKIGSLTITSAAAVEKSGWTLGRARVTTSAPCAAQKRSRLQAPRLPAHGPR